MTNQKVWELSKQAPVQQNTIDERGREVLRVREDGSIHLVYSGAGSVNEFLNKTRAEYPDACIIVRDYRGVIVYTVNERALEVEPVDRWANEGEHDTAFNEGV